MRVKARDVWEDVEEGLGSVGKIRILREMVFNPEQHFTKYMLERATGLKPRDVRKSLQTLIDLGWVLENPCDPKTYRLNVEDETVKLIIEFFRKLGTKV